MNENQHFAFRFDDPLELRFGFEVNAGFWSLFSNDVITVIFNVHQFGHERARIVRTLTTDELAGVPSNELWLGMALRSAHQVTDNQVGVFAFRPQIWLHRIESNKPMKFAIAPTEHSFAVEFGGEQFPLPRERLTGGAGRPPGSPPD